VKSWIIPGIVLAVAFASTRMPALALQAQDTDVNLYARYAAEWQAAAREGQSFYALHRHNIEEEIRHASPEQAAALAPYKSVEYPPLAVTFMAIPAWLTLEPFEQVHPTGPQPRYARSYILLLACCDLILLLLVVMLVRQLYGTEPISSQLQRCLVYVLCAWPLYAVLYTRLDLALALLVTAALALLVCRIHWSVALALLAVAIHFKLIPLVLVPVWLVGSLPTTIFGASWWTLTRQLTLRAGVLVVFGLPLLAPYFICHGPAVLEFLGYHKDRGIEIESVWATLLLPVWAADHGWEVYHSHGSVNVRTTLTPLLTSLAGPVLAGLLAMATAGFLAAIWQRHTAASPHRPELPDSHASPCRCTIAQRWPRLVAGFTLLLLLISIVANKVFSPQYLLWVLPLVPLVDLRPGPRRLFFAATFAMCYLTMCIFPDGFVGQIVVVNPDAGGSPSFGGPTPFGAFLLAARNCLAVALTAALTAALLPLPHAWSLRHRLAYLFQSPRSRPTVA
jgi:hypothetical protein